MIRNEIFYEEGYYEVPDAHSLQRHMGLDDLLDNHTSSMYIAMYDK